MMQFGQICSLVSVTTLPQYAQGLAIMVFIDGAHNGKYQVRTMRVAKVKDSDFGDAEQCCQGMSERGSSLTYDGYTRLHPYRARRCVDRATAFRQDALGVRGAYGTRCGRLGLGIF